MMSSVTQEVLPSGGENSPILSILFPAHICPVPNLVETPPCVVPHFTYFVHTRDGW
jgi:hypothetical protein